MSAPRIIGVNSWQRVTPSFLRQVEVEVGQAPSFCGRYFTRPDSGGPEYKRALEGEVLGSRGIRVLPIARQTNHVGGSFELGHADALANSSDLLASFGHDYLMAQGGRFRLYLDVEGPPHSILSAEYWGGWSRGLSDGGGAVVFLPCMYGLQGDARSWKAALSSPCHGGWIAHLEKRPVEPVEWPDWAADPIAGIQAQVLQYEFGRTYDRNLVNPALADASEWLKTLILPPHAG